jgi:hypothetical protein
MSEELRNLPTGNVRVHSGLSIFGKQGGEPMADRRLLKAGEVRRVNEDRRIRSRGRRAVFRVRGFGSHFGLEVWQKFTLKMFADQGTVYRTSTRRGRGVTRDSRARSLSLNSAADFRPAPAEKTLVGHKYCSSFLGKQ